MIKKFFFALCVVLFATSMMAQTGLTCEDPIPVDSSYSGVVDGPCELWYTAGTYDLPLHVYFSPNSLESDWSPEVLVDLTCTPGVYDDPKVDSLLTMVEDFGLEFPIELLCDMVVRNGKVEWDLSINQSYRDQLSEFGITYNVPAYVKVRFYEGGTIRMTPDTAFTSCMDNAHYILLDDSIDVLADDSERAFVVPYADWQNDSIRFVWTGEQPAQIYLATTKCDFAIDGGYVWDNFEVTSETPYKLYSSQMKDAIKNQQGGGIFYGKIVSSTPGKLVVEKIPMSQAQGGAVMMTYGQSISLKANDNTLYCFPRTWSATQFLSSAQTAVSMYVSNQPDFTPSIDDANVLAGYEFEYEEGQRVLYLSNADLAPVFSQLSGDYVYVRFSTSAATAITPSAWTASRCMVNSVMIHPNKTFTITKNSNTVYRFKYADYEGYGFVLKPNVSTTLPTYIADTCTFGLTTGDKHVIRNTNIGKGKQMTIKPDVYAGWASRVDADGYLYVRFNSTNAAGTATFVTDKPADVPITPDPINTTITETLCYGESYEWNGQVYATTGEYTQNFTAANGADSIVTLKLTILPEVAPTTEEATIEAGETYTWNGKEYSEAGEYTITLQDKNGCDYQATLVLTVNEPLSPCLQSSIKLNVGDEVVINLDSAFTVYAIDYAAWMAQPVTLEWTGAEALHTFVAETCVFALAPYNRYVHAYVPVPAQGDSALDMEALAPYVDADGYLYVRFLTEFEGTLKVGQ